MRYYGDICPVCNKEFSESDDIVVCPDCGTPHHRHCFVENGHCFNLELHADGFSWRSDKNEAEKPAQELTQSDSKPQIVCPVCKHENPPSSEHCEFCGQKFTIFGFNVFEKQIELEMQDNEEKHKKEEEKNKIVINNVANENETSGNTAYDVYTVDGVSTDDLSEYIRINHVTYVKKFDKLSNKGKKITWNWASFIFLPYWFFYRKLIKPGIIFLMALLCINVIFSQPINAISDRYYSFVDVITENEVTQQQIDNSQHELMNEISKQTPFIVTYFALLLIIRIIAALVSDKLYRKKAITDISNLRSKQLDEEAFHFSMFKVGGTAPLLVVAAYVAQYALSYLISFVMSLAA